MSKIVEKAKASNGDKVIRLRRIGACPFLRFTPYENNRGVRVHMWSCISITFKAMPERTLLSYPRIIEPDELDDYNVRMFTTEWVEHQIQRTRENEAELVPVEETPFGGNMMQWEGL